VPSERIPFEPGRENEILLQVITLLSDMAKSNAKNVSSAAISGPNTLVLMFPKSYHFSKQFFDRSPEQLKRVEKAIEQVVGKPVQASLAVDETDASANGLTRESTQKIPPELPRQGSLPEAAATEQTSSGALQDPLVQRAIIVFGARVVKTERAVAPPVVE
jgi:hypothetical protein